jgi:hypothetical protein
MAEVAKTFSVTSRGVGLPDYSVAKPVGQVPVGPIYTSSDTGELAARLGSPVTFDRRGNVIFYDNFEDGYDGKWNVSGTFPYPDGYPCLTIEPCRSGIKSVRLRSVAAVDAYMGLWRYLPILRFSKLGFEVSFTTAATYTYYQWQFTIWTGTQQIEGRIQLLPLENTLRLRTTGGVWQDIDTDVQVFAGGSLFNTVKMVIDPLSELYTRLIYNSTEYDTSLYSLPIVDSVIAAHLRLDFRVIATGGGAPDAAEANFDDVIVTQNEPDNEL